MSPYDEHVEFHVRSMEDLAKVLNDPEYMEKVSPGEKRLSESRSMVTAGWDEVYVSRRNDSQYSTKSRREIVLG
jgi:hypothetical protein